jgi:hypothetical protein
MKARRIHATAVKSFLEHPNVIANCTGLAIACNSKKNDLGAKRPLDDVCGVS